jgi:predicted enzyme related to lactoylglutathione lyase
MPERKEYAPGTPSWIDLQTTDPNAAKQFYGELFGWTYDDQAIPESDGAVYSMAQLKGHDVAAIASMPPGPAGIPPHWNTYITVSDADDAVAIAEKAGGTVMMPAFDVMDAGRMAVIADPTGAIFNVWQAKNHIGAGLVNEPGTLSWNELMDADLPKAAEFYKKLFGWEANVMGDYTEFKLNGQSVGGAMKPPMPGIPNVWGVYITVADTDATVAQAKSLGGAVFQEPMDIEPGRLAVLADPQGAMFNVIKLTREVS